MLPSLNLKLNLFSFSVLTLVAWVIVGYVNNAALPVSQVHRYMTTCCSSQMVDILDFPRSPIKLASYSGKQCSPALPCLSLRYICCSSLIAAILDFFIVSQINCN